MVSEQWQFGVSYFGVRNPHHFRADLEVIARLGFDYLVFTFSEHDHRFYQGSVAQCVRLTQQRGLKAYVDPWGVCGIFGGEAFSERGAWDLEGQQRRSDGRPLPLLCPTSAEVRAYLRQWLTAVAEVLQADGVFWDEPHFYLPGGESRRRGLWACCCPRCQQGFAARFGQPLPAQETPEVRQWKEEAIAALLRELTAQAAAAGLRNTVCVLPIYEDPQAFAARLERLAADPHLHVLATDPYPLYHRQPVAATRRFCDALRHVCRRFHKEAQVWVQGFLVPAGEEAQLAEEIRLIAASGIRNIAVWSYLATAYMTSHACADPDTAWAVITQALQEVRQAGAPRL
ncbi:MAG: hypothetical protein KatS3mg131_1089 [Candidatus Tectimicrobiota bacterium]|nr:MAG: hypothetical protein KatS3mg131_1089 [Candidatus Tectomicrobia bacterium]